MNIAYKLSHCVLHFGAQGVTRHSAEAVKAWFWMQSALQTASFGSTCELKLFAIVCNFTVCSLMWRTTDMNKSFILCVYSRPMSLVVMSYRRQNMLPVRSIKIWEHESAVTKNNAFLCAKQPEPARWKEWSLGPPIVEHIIW
jgi:hypothetical protein